MKNWIRSLVVVGCLSGVALAPLAEAEAALNAYLRLKGQKQGDIRGGLSLKGRGSIAVVAFGHEIVSPRDPASGLPTGKRQHKPLVITKELDKSTPLLYNVLVNNENVSEWELQVFGQTAAGTEGHLYTIKLTNANIASIRTYDDKDTGKLMEQISFTYQRIEWIWVAGGIMALDDWATPTVK